jgi:serine/threonine protein kinase/TolB-like protein/Flp pilus assembly protein TadD
MDNGGTNHPQTAPVPEGAGNALTSERWHQIKKVFSAALDCEGAARNAYLREACRDDEALRAEVQSLLAAAAGDGVATSKVFQAVSSSAPGQALSEGDDPMLGRRMGAYRIEQRIGFGGMASVYRASRADQEFCKSVAIKLLRPDLDNKELLRRFRNERQTLAVLDHPNIVRLLDGGTTDEGLPYLVMDYVEGRPIDDYCDAHTLTVEQRLRLFCTVCDAVRCAHRAHIIHRDLKPNNILVTDDCTPKLLDFGIAKVLSGQDTSESAITSTANRHLTPAYASPEQVRGEAVTAATDVYSLGVVLYELLTGHRPYRLKQRTPAEIERAICEQDPESPSSAIDRVETEQLPDGTSVEKSAKEISRTREGEPGKLRRSLRGDLDNILIKALQKDLLRRYASVEEFEQDIRSHLEHRPVKARPSTMAYRASKFSRRHKTEVIALVMAFSIFLGALGFSVWEHQQAKVKTGLAPVEPRRLLEPSSLAEPPVMLAVLPFDNLTGDASQEFFGDGLTEEMITQLGSVNHNELGVIARTSVMSYKDHREPIRQIGSELGVQYVVGGSFRMKSDGLRITAQLIRVSDQTPLWAAEYDRKMDEIVQLQGEVALNIAREIRVRLTPQAERRLASVRPVSGRAYKAYLQGQFYWNRRTPEDLKKSREFYLQATQQDPEYAAAYAGLARTLFSLGTYSVLPSSVAFSGARDAANKAVVLDPFLAEAHSVLAVIADYSDWNWSEAEKEYKHALDLDPNYATAHHWYAVFLGRMGRFDECLAEMQTAHRLDPRSMIINTDIGGMLLYKGAVQEDINQQRSVLAADPSFTPAHANLAWALERAGRYHEAVQELQVACRMAPTSVAYKAALGRAYGLDGNHAEVARILSELTGPKRQYVSPYSIATIYTGLGDKDLAFQWLEKAYAEHDFWMAFLKVDPREVSLHSEPRFRQLMFRMRLPSDEVSGPRNSGQPKP